MVECTPQDALRSSLEASIIPAFEMSCKALFDQVDATFQKGLSKHTTSVQQQFESTHSPLAIALRVCVAQQDCLLGSRYIFFHNLLIAFDKCHIEVGNTFSCCSCKI